MEALELFPHQRSSAVQSAAYGTDRDTQDTGDGFVVETVDFTEDEDGAKFVAQSAQCGLDLSGAFSAKQVFCGRVARVGRVALAVVDLWIEGDDRGGPSLVAEGRIDGNSIEPGIE